MKTLTEYRDSLETFLLFLDLREVYTFSEIFFHDERFCFEYVVAKDKILNHIVNCYKNSKGS